MKISYNWLKDYLNININPQELSKVLTDCGLEVEELERWQSVKGGLEGIRIGQITKIEKHPNADKLQIAFVNVDMGTELQIVCGAPNIEVDQKVLVATIGSKLYKGDESFEIKKCKIRNIESFGMICSEEELGLGHSNDGIMVLPNDAEIGLEAKNYFQISEDFIFTIGLTPNRIDAAAHLGVARDVMAVLNHAQSSKLHINLPEISEETNIHPSDFNFDVIVEDELACPRYSGVILKNINVAPSPKWLADRLLSAGMRPINNVVDITNYVMLELGQPLHAFDLSKIKGNKVIVKKHKQLFDFVTLDGVTRKITPNDLMICNDDEPMCIAGVFGGVDSSVDSNTKGIFLESAYFNTVSIRKTSSAHALKTESSFRFERGADPSITVFALKRAIKLFQDICKAEVSSVIFDVYPLPIERKTIEFSPSFVNKVIGKEIDTDMQLSILKDLDFEILSLEKDIAVVSPPFAKVDVTRPADIVEEILRIYGYNNIPFPEKFNSALPNIKGKTNQNTQNFISEMLVGNGFYEIMTNSLSASSLYENFKEDFSKPVYIMNPLSSELNVMRQSLLFSGIESIVYNINRKQPNLKFFEFGKNYFKNSSDSSKDVRIRYNEETVLGLFMTGNTRPLNWKYKDEESTFFHLKNFIELIFKRLGVQKMNYSEKEISSSLFESGLSFFLLNNNIEMARIGLVSHKVLDLYECKQDVFYAEIKWDAILKELVFEDLKTDDPPKFPEVHRDIAILINKSTKYSAIESIILENGNDLIKNIRLFDIYEGDKIPEDKKSYAINIILQNTNKTLNDNETDIIINNIKGKLVSKLGASIR